MSKSNELIAADAAAALPYWKGALANCLADIRAMRAANTGTAAEAELIADRMHTASVHRASILRCRHNIARYSAPPAPAADHAGGGDWRFSPADPGYSGCPTASMVNPSGVNFYVCWFDGMYEVGVHTGAEEPDAASCWSLERCSAWLVANGWAALPSSVFEAFAAHRAAQN